MIGYSILTKMLFQIMMNGADKTNPDRLYKSVGAYYLFSAIQILLSVGALDNFSDKNITL